MPATYRLGYQGKLYYSLTTLTTSTAGAGSATAATWTEITNVMDFDSGSAADKVDSTTRAEAATGFSSSIQGLSEAEWSWTMRAKQNDTVLNALLNVAVDKVELALLDLDGPKGSAGDEGNHGLGGNFTLSFTKKAPLKGLMVFDFKASLSSYPLYVKVDNTGALVAF